MTRTNLPSIRPAPPALSVLSFGWVFLLLVLGSGLTAQVPTQIEAGPDQDLIARADSLFDAGEAKAALELLRPELVARDSTGYALLWRAARAATAEGTLLPGPYPQNHLFEEAMRWGELAEAESVNRRVNPSGEPLAAGVPADVTGGYWQFAATGLRAKNAAPSFGAELADQIWNGGYALLERSPRDSRLHSLIGRLHFEVMSLSRMERLLGRVIVGGSVLGKANWEDAETHLNRAVELAPSDPRYLIDLARLHAARGRPTAARLLAERVLGLNSDTPNARAMKEEARVLLADLRR